MASYLGLRNKFLPNLRQYEATTGRPISDRAMQNYLYAALQTEADRRDTAYARERQFGFQQQGLDIQKQAIKDQAAANKISGITQLAGLPFQGYLGYRALKAAGIFGKDVAPGVAGTTTEIPSLGAFAGSNPYSTLSLPAKTGYGLTGTAQGMLSGGTGAAGTSQGLLATGGVTAPADIAAGTTAAATGAESAGTGFLGTAGTTVAPATAGSFAGRALGSAVSSLLGTHLKTTRDVMGVAGGAAAGFAVGGPIGAVIGGAIGFISSLF